MPATDPLLALFARYNPAIWPLQAVAGVGALVVVALIVLRPSRTSDRLATGFLAAVWVFIGLVFHAVYVREIDAVQSVVYAVAFLAQGALLLWLGVARDRVAYRPGRSLASAVGLAAIAYALVAYPLIGIALGHPYPEAPLFGAAPCPTTIFTFGLLLLARPPLPKVLLLVPLAWAVVATPAAVGRGILEDVALLGVALVAVGIVIACDRRAGALGRAGADVTTAGLAGSH